MLYFLDVASLMGGRGYPVPESKPCPNMGMRAVTGYEMKLVISKRTGLGYDFNCANCFFTSSASL